MKSAFALVICAAMLSFSTLAAGIPLQGDEPDATLTVSLAALSPTSYAWFEDILVTATVTLSGSPALGCTVLATCPLNTLESSPLLDNGIAPDAVANNGVYTGYYRLGGANGSAVLAQTGNRITVTATRPGDSGTAQTGQFTTFRAERWTGRSTDAPGTYPDNRDTYANFIVTKVSTHWHHKLVNFGIVSSATKTGALIRLPVYPKANTAANLTVVNGTEAKVVDNVIQFKANLANGGTARCTIEFDAPSDLAATYIDRYNTGHIGLRQFRNGYIAWNSRISQAVFGSPCTTPHGQGVNCGMQVLEESSGLMRSIDCMERVAIVYDGALFNNGDSSYPYNIKWQDQTDNSWLVSADLSQITFNLRSKTTYCNGKLAINKTVQFFSGERYIRQNYTIRNVDTVPHTATLLWGREQWMYGDTTYLDDNDRGYVGTGAALYGSGFRVDGSTMAEGFFGAVDIGTYYSLGVIFTNATDRPTYLYFLLTPPLTSTGGAYPVDYSGTGADEGSTFFEKQYGSLAAGAAAYDEFYMWGGYGTSAADTQSMVAADALEIAAKPAFDIGFGPGWNLLSIPLQMQDTSIESVLSGISGDWDVAKYYDCTDAADPWKSWRSGGTVNDFTRIDRTVGFWLHATSACTLSVAGTIPESTAIELHVGWNLVGYPSATPRLASATLPEMADRVSVWNATSPYITDYSDKTQVTMSQGNGYWVHVIADCTWTVGV